MKLKLVSIAFSIFWLAFVFHGISIMKPPWSDDLFFILPAVNAHQGQGFAVPELTGYNKSEVGWTWHMPLFPMACWVATLFSIELPAIRSVSVLSSLLIVLFSAGILMRLFPPRHRVAYYILFLFILGFDKSIIGNAVQGRPEPSMMAAFVIAFYLLLPGQKTSPRRVLAAGFSAGLSASFHPLGLFLAGAYVPLLLRTSQGSSIVMRFKPFLLFGLGAVVPCSLSLVWLVRDMNLFNDQFLYNARLTGTPDLLVNTGKILRTIQANFRFQPVYLVLLPSVLIGSLFVRKSDNSTSRLAFMSVLLALAGCLVFLLRGSSEHFYYYMVIAIIFIFLIGIFASRLNDARWQLALLLPLMLNQFAFASVKTYVVMRNQPAVSHSQLDRELAILLQNKEAKMVLPPNLWLWAEQRGVNYRLTNPSIGYWEKDMENHTDYWQSLLDWQPTFIVIEMEYQPPMTAAIPRELIEANQFQQVGSFKRQYRHRPVHSGYDLRIFERQP